MPCKKLAYLFPLAVFTGAIANSHAQQEMDLASNTFMSLQMSLIAQQEAESAPLQRLSTSRHFGRGYSYADDFADMGVWGQMLASGTSQDDWKNDEGNALSGFDADAEGFTLGFDRSTIIGHYEITYGAAFTIADVKADKQNSKDYNRLKNRQMNIYGSYTRDEWYLDGVVNYGWSRNDRTRHVGSEPSGKSEFDSNNYGLKLLAGFNYPYLNTIFQPLLGFNYSRITIDDYRETLTGNVGQAQAVSGQTYQKMELGAGLEMSQIYELPLGDLEPSARIMGWYDMKGDKVKAHSTLTGSGDELSVEAGQPVKSSYSASFNLTYRRLDNLSVIVSYDLNQKSDYRNHSYYLRAEYDF
ncbi:autotransporter outer membrane beta-barrel domain-containing protein [Endozoicomonas euniceicola]|uniref:Autotransporter outer membrane beta-barrel domain-containing protein n=1 Tax=Endozoicomonas euniceicola TaxID=1234143 RepID=A0ABY6H1D7_9GAMM|nr:autotransporter outer membrane beta-barrel domain-containing protein [Endozoicomonas euniceicola]UYM18617.1 autotransporter outer membrane beta-barrel domain-containing protein [Endozoicomonas euniceicola]